MVYKCHYIVSFYLWRSGSDEVYTEKVKLLEEISILMIEGEEMIEKKKQEKLAEDKEAQKRKKLKKQGEDIRIKAMQGLVGKWNIYM